MSSTKILASGLDTVTRWALRVVSIGRGGEWSGEGKKRTDECYCRQRGGL